MKRSKIIIASVLLGSVANVALAESSGVFIGAEVGYGGANVEYKNHLQETNQEFKYTAKYDGGGVKYGFVAGYKQFFTPYLGLRYYASLSAMHASISHSGMLDSGVSFTERKDDTMINYGVNVDFLGNFIVKDNISFGGFVGLGIGGTSWLGKHIDDYQKQVDNIWQGFKLNKNSFDVALNVGLRANIAKHHGVEIVGRVPFVPTKLLDKTETYSEGEFYSEKTTLHHPYSITARYTFSF